MNDVRWLCLAAGRGTRLRPITDDKPKAMVPVADRPMIDWLVETARHVGIEDCAAVTGYAADVLRDHVGDDMTTVENPEYDSTDMVRSLWCAEELLDGPVVLSYSDILYTPTVLESVLDSPHDIAVAVDDAWKPYWETRHEAPVEDAESLQLAEDDRITSIGQAVDSIAAPEAQYVGLMRFSAAGVEQLREAYRDAERADERGENPFGGERSLGELHMTDMLQELVDRGADVYATRIEGLWVEIDTPRDLEIARSACQPTGDGKLHIDRTAREADGNL